MSDCCLFVFALQTSSTLLGISCKKKKKKKKKVLTESYLCCQILEKFLFNPVQANLIKVGGTKAIPVTWWMNNLIISNLGFRS